jgi:hypothetical protein
MTYRNVVAKKGDNMAVVDVSRDLCGKMKYRAGVLKIKMVPQIWCETAGTYETEDEANTAALTALTNGERT